MQNDRSRPYLRYWPSRITHAQIYHVKFMARKYHGTAFTWRANAHFIHSSFMSFFTAVSVLYPVLGFFFIILYTIRVFYAVRSPQSVFYTHSMVNFLLLYNIQRYLDVSTQIPDLGTLSTFLIHIVHV